MPNDADRTSPKIKVTVPEVVIRDAASSAKRVLGPLAEIIGDMFSGKVRFLRFRAAVKTLEMAAKIAKENGVEPKQTPIKLSGRRVGSAT